MQQNVPLNNRRRDAVYTTEERTHNEKAEEAYRLSLLRFYVIMDFIRWEQNQPPKVKL